MLQSSLNGWLKKDGPVKQDLQPAKPPPTVPAAANQPRPPPPRSISTQSRTPPSSTPTPAAMDNWNDIPDDFLQVPSRPRSKKSPRSSRAVTPAATPRVPSPAIPTPPQQTSLSQLFALRSLPPNVELAPLTEELLPSFKHLNALTLPIPYPESFYKETMTEPHKSLTLVALWHPSRSQNGSEPERPQLVGAIRCRLLPSSQLYISTLGILAPYRTHGIAMHLLQEMVRKAVDLHQVRCVTAHVWEANEEGLTWYKKRNFEFIGTEEGYYRKLRPQSAVLVRRWIGVSDLLENGTSPQK